MKQTARWNDLFRKDNVNEKYVKFPWDSQHWQKITKKGSNLKTFKDGMAELSRVFFCGADLLLKQQQRVEF